MLMSSEVALGAVFGRSMADQLVVYGSLAGAIGLAAQVIFALIPVIQAGSSASQQTGKIPPLSRRAIFGVSDRYQTAGK